MKYYLSSPLLALLVLIITSILLSCSRIDDIETRLDVLEQKVETLEQTVGALQSAYDGGKIITDVTSTEAGYKIIFSDNSSINILNGNDGSDGITPILSIDVEGYWIISLDNGETFELLKDNQGNPVIGVGKNGADGENGENGKDGISVRVVAGEDGNYVIETYYENNPEVVIESIKTAYTSVESKIITSIVENSEEGTITITTADGTSFSFYATGKIFDLEGRINILEQRVETLEGAVKVLEEAYADGKIIVSVESIDGGYKVTFSDETFIEVMNGKDGENGADGLNGTNGVDGITPIISMDSNGYWTVSYDNGETFSKLVDNNGDQVSGLGKDGVDGTNGSNGIDGKDGISVRVVINENGNYAYELYDPVNPEVVIETITTPFTSDKAQIISSITQDNSTNAITITMANGDTFTFNKQVIVPASIAILNTKPLMIGHETAVSFEFRVNPSNASFDFDVESEDCEILLDLLAETRSYVTTPSNYKLSKVEPVYNEQGVVKQGQYKANITDLGKSTAYKDMIALVIQSKDVKGAVAEISSSVIELQYTSNIITEFTFLSAQNTGTVINDVKAVIEGNEIKVASPFISSANGLVANFSCNGYKVFVNGVEQESGISVNDFSSPVVYRVVDQNGIANEYKVSVMYSGLPVVIVNTPNNVPITSKEEWTGDTEIKILNPDGTVSYEGTTSFRGRGNSTWNYPKKPYAIKLDKKASILGMPKHKRWVLLANWMDRTLMRNRVAFKLGECTQMEWTPRGEYVELVLNGEHLGNYFLCEQVKVDENRVNVAEIDPESEDISGGYLLELDTNYDEAFKFMSAVKGLPYMFKDPDEDITDEMFNYVQNYVNSMEDYLYNDFNNRKWADYIDLNSFVDYWFAVELTSNNEPAHPKSVYMYKDKGEKLCAGPMWDYDWGCFTPGRSQAYYLKNTLYYPQLFNDAEYVSTVKERWPEAKANFVKVAEFIDTEAEKIKNSEKMNTAMWPISSRVNGDETMTFEESVERLKKSYLDKLEWLDQQINNM